MLKNVIKDLNKYHFLVTYFREYKLTGLNKNYISR